MPRSFGLDLKGGFLLCAEVVYDGIMVSSLTLSYAPLPEGAVYENGGLNWDLVTALIHDHLGPSLPDDVVSSVLEAPGVVTRTAMVPQGLAVPVEEFLQREVLEFKVFDNRDVALDFFPSGAQPKQGEAGDLMLELAVDQELVDPWRDALQSWNPRDAFLESALTAQLRLYYWMVQPGETNQMLVIVEDAQTHVVNLQWGAVRFMRTFEIGSQMLVEAGESRPLGSTDLVDIEDDFLDELIRTVHYIRTTYTDQEFEESIHLTARSYAPGMLAPHLQARLGISVYAIDPFAGLPIANAEELQESGMDGLLFTQAIGAALRGIQQELLPLNVFPRAFFEQREMKKSLIALLAPVAGALLIPLLFKLVLGNQAKNAKVYQEERQARLQQLQMTVARKQELVDTLTYLRAKSKPESAQDGINDWPAFLMDLTNLFPTGLWLESVSYDGVTGEVVFSGLSLDPKYILLLEKNLKESPFLEELKRGSTPPAALNDEAKTPVTRFTMSAKLKVREG